MRICEFTINSNFITSNCPQLLFSSNELDGIDHTEKFARVFRVTVDIVNPSEPIMGESDLFSKHLDNTLNKPLALYKNHNEFQQKINDFRK